MIIRKGEALKNYKFSLQSVLEIRDNEEKGVLEDFVLVQNSLVEEENKIQRLKNELHICLSRGICNRSVQDLIRENLYKSDLDRKVDLQEHVIEEKKQELEEVRKKLQTAQKDKKIMEKLKEKDLDEYKSEILKKSQKEIDEFAVLRFKRV